VSEAPDEPTALDLLKMARFYVNHFKPESLEEDFEREELLRKIDALFPPPPMPAIELCDDPQCCLQKGHDGPHDEIPF
jgi:hypothetical protein